MIKNKHQLRQHTKRMIVLGFLLGAIFGTILGGFIVWKNMNSSYQSLNEDYSWLEESSKNCWWRLRELDKNCWDTSDCSKNPNLTGCHKLDCNWCCFNECTLMMCVGR